MQRREKRTKKSFVPARAARKPRRPRGAGRRAGSPGWRWGRQGLPGPLGQQAQAAPRGGREGPSSRGFSCTERRRHRTGSPRGMWVLPGKSAAVLKSDQAPSRNRRGAGLPDTAVPLGKGLLWCRDDGGPRVGKGRGRQSKAKRMTGKLSSNHGLSPRPLIPRMLESAPLTGNLNTRLAFNAFISTNTAPGIQSSHSQSAEKPDPSQLPHLRPPKDVPR